MSIGSAPAQSIVFVVDDDISVRESLELLIAHEGWRPEMFSSAQEFLGRPAPPVPSCVILDVNLPDLNGLDVQSRLSIRRRTMPIIFITGHGDVPMSVRAMKAGALEFLTKPFDDEELLAAIRHALEVSDEARRDGAGLQDLRDRYATLTPRERQVMTLVVSGLLNKQVADELAITEITVKSHRGQVMRKMNASSFAELVNMDAALHPGSRATSSRVP
jgi:FixJ family two-component response regulator